MDARCLNDKHRSRRGTSLRTRVLPGILVSISVVTLSAASPSSATTSGPSTSPASAANGTGQSASDLAAPSASSGCPSTACSSVLAEVATAAKIKTLPSNLTPPLQDAVSDLRVPPGGNCGTLGIPGLSPMYEPCTYGSSRSHTKIVLLGESHAWMWSIPIESIAQSHGDSFALLYHSACNVMPTAGSLPVQGAVGQAPSGAQCAQWTKAAISWINAYKPQVVILTTVGGFDTPQQESTYLEGLHDDFQALQAPGRRLIMLGDIPLPAQSGPDCLAAHESDVQSCSTPESAAVNFIFLQNRSYVREAATLKTVGASLVDVIPWFCTKSVCPAVIGNYEVYQDKFHATSTYAAHLTAVMNVALGLSPTS